MKKVWNIDQLQLIRTEMNIKQLMVKIYEIIHVKLISTLAKRDVIFMY